MWLSQVRAEGDNPIVVVREGDIARRLEHEATVYALAQRAIRQATSLIELVAKLGQGERVDLEAAAREGRILAPIAHPDPAHLFVTGTGLTHLGSAAARDAMHAAAKRGKVGKASKSGKAGTAGKAGKAGKAADAALTDSMRMFNMGLEGGRPKPGKVGAQPEWFYKGNGTILAAPGAPLMMPDFAGDGGEEPEIAGVYVVGPDGTPFRIGFALANEFSDHVTERINYLYLAHSKLRPAAIGPELRLGELPNDIPGVSRIFRGDSVVWEKPFVSGEDNMSHTIANLEHHHFKYALFRHPGDVHVHMFGTATLSFSDNFRAEPGDVFQIEAPEMGLPLRNPLAVEKTDYAAARPL